MDSIDDVTRSLLRQVGGRSTTDDAFKKTVRGRGGSTAAIANWVPTNKGQDNIERPGYLALAHELIHCLHYIAGDCARPITLQDSINADSGLSEEEARTVGLGPYAYPHHSEPFCENAIRAAFNEPLRREYIPGNDLSFVKRSLVV